MPWTHRYIGNPIISAIFRLFFRARLSIRSAHAGVFPEAYQRMHLRTLGMEFATEMIVAALQKRLRIAEIPSGISPGKGNQSCGRS